MGKAPHLQQRGKLEGFSSMRTGLRQSASDARSKWRSAGASEFATEMHACMLAGPPMQIWCTRLHLDGILELTCNCQPSMQLLAPPLSPLSYASSTARLAYFYPYKLFSCHSSFPPTQNSSPALTHTHTHTHQRAASVRVLAYACVLVHIGPSAQCSQPKPAKHPLPTVISFPLSSFYAPPCPSHAVHSPPSFWPPLYI
jgi:hypothetical protein